MAANSCFLKTLEYYKNIIFNFFLESKLRKDQLLFFDIRVAKKKLKVRNGKN